MNELETILKLANEQVGYLEKSNAAYKADHNVVYEMTKGAGANDITKYAYDLDQVTNFYNGKKNGFAWCSVFVAWLFWKSFGTDRARELIHYPSKSCGAGCKYAKGYFEKVGAFYTSNPQKGDQIFFKSGSNWYHTGFVVDVDSKYVYTIEGNTSNAAEVVANGGCVAKKKYLLTNAKIGGYGRPAYKNTVQEEAKEETPATPTQEAEVKSDLIYIVVKGDNLTKIAKKYNTTVNALANYNNIKNINVIKVGQQIKIPQSEVTYPTKLVVAKSGLNVRNKASLLGKKLRVLANGTKVTVYKTVGSWSKISDTAEEYVYSSYLK